MKKINTSFAHKIILKGTRFDTEELDILNAPDAGMSKPWVISAAELAIIIGMPQASTEQLVAACEGYVFNKTKDGANFMFDRAQLESLFSAHEVVKIQSASAKVPYEQRGGLIASCLFLDGEKISRGDDEKMQLIKLLGQMESPAGNWDTGDFYYVPRSAVLQPEFPGDLQRWDEAKEAGVIGEFGKGYLVPKQMVDVLERATGKTLAQAQALYQSTRSTSDRTPD